MTFYALVIFIAVSILNIPDDHSKKISNSCMYPVCLAKKIIFTQLYDQINSSF